MLTISALSERQPNLDYGQCWSSYVELVENVTILENEKLL